MFKKITLILFLYGPSICLAQIRKDTAFVSTASHSLVSFINLNVELSFKAKNRQTLSNAIKNNTPLLITYEKGELKTAKAIFIPKKTILRKYFNISPSVLNTKLSIQANVLKNNKRLQNITLELAPLLKPSANPAEVQDIFNYVKLMACNHTSTCTNTGIPCITFQYKQNGCQARAHLMRGYIEDSLHFASQKIFVFGSLRAANTGTCDGNCVGWGWHVAPLVNQADAAGTITQMVIDPSLFDKAVTVEEWKNAQLNCGNGAHIDEVQIIASSNYSWNMRGVFHRQRYFYPDPNNVLTYGFLRDNCDTCHP